MPNYIPLDINLYNVGQVLPHSDLNFISLPAKHPAYLHTSILSTGYVVYVLDGDSFKLGIYEPSTDKIYTTGNTFITWGITAADYTLNLYNLNMLNFLWNTNKGRVVSIKDFIESRYFSVDFLYSPPNPNYVFDKQDGYDYIKWSNGTIILYTYISDEAVNKTEMYYTREKLYRNTYIVVCPEHIENLRKLIRTSSNGFNFIDTSPANLKRTNFSQSLTNSSTDCLYNALADFIKSEFPEENIEFTLYKPDFELYSCNSPFFKDDVLVSNLISLLPYYIIDIIYYINDNGVKSIARKFYDYVAIYKILNYIALIEYDKEAKNPKSFYITWNGYVASGKEDYEKSISRLLITEGVYNKNFISVADGLALENKNFPVREFIGYGTRIIIYHKIITVGENEYPEDCYKRVYEYTDSVGNNWYKCYCIVKDYYDDGSIIKYRYCGNLCKDMVGVNGAYLLTDNDYIDCNIFPW